MSVVRLGLGWSRSGAPRPFGAAWCRGSAESSNCNPTGDVVEDDRNTDGPEGVDAYMATTSTSWKITQNKALLVGGFAAYFALLWVFWYSPAIYPLKIFVVLLHEISHGLAAVATGGTIERIILDPMEGGACFCPGGNTFLTLSAGYLGSLVWGLLLVAVSSRFPRGSRMAVGLVGALVLILTVSFVRSAFGLGFGVLFGLALLGSARFLPALVNRLLLMALGLTSALYAVLDIKSDVLDRPELESDARMLAEVTGIPTVVWGVLWIGVALAISVMAMRSTVRQAGRNT